jgi:SAM-dependent methyltransferase
MGQLPDAPGCRRVDDALMTTAADRESFQLPIEAAEFYEAAFVPAFFAQWAPILCEAADVADARHVLDVACGTGIVARTAAELVAPDRGRVVGLDLNEAMLTVARRVRPDLDWRQGDAGDLPFEADTFDVVLSQMALMFLPDQPLALREMARVTEPGGTVALLVPGRLDAQPAFAPFVEMAAGHAGAEARSLLTTYFACGDLDALAALVGTCGLTVSSRRTVDGTYRAPSVDAFVTTEVESTPLAERMGEEANRRIREDAPRVLAPFTTADGVVEAPFEANLVVARRP